MSDQVDEQDGLTPRDLEVLEFERLRFKHAGAKESQILERWGWSPTRYHQVVNQLIDRPEALEYDGQLVNRLRRLRDRRQQQRRARRVGLDT